MADQTFNKIPPQNIEVEQSLLGALLLDKNAFDKIADIVQPTDFYKDAHRYIFEVMQTLYSKQEPLDLVTVSNLLEEKKLIERIGGRSYLASLANIVPTSAHIVQYATITRKKATLRRLQNAASEITELSFQEDNEIDELLDTAEQKLFSVSQKWV